MEAGGGGPPPTEAGPGTLPEEGGPETGQLHEEAGPPSPGRPEGPCPPAATILADMPCQAGPQTCAGHPTVCDGATFYDAFVCANDSSSGPWLWQSVATTICPDAGLLDGEPGFDASPIPIDGNNGAPVDPSTPVFNQDACVPWSSVRGQPFMADDAGQSLATLTKDGVAIVGAWVGHAVAPWGQWDVSVTFLVGGHYIEPSTEFYYGDSRCTSLEQWRLLDVSAAGAASGQIDVPFAGSQEPDGSLSCDLPAWQGEVSLLIFSVDGNRLRFDFSRSDGYGPIVYDLWRACQTD